MVKGFYQLIGLESSDDILAVQSWIVELHPGINRLATDMIVVECHEPVQTKSLS
jgi:hypothetical protein